MFRGIYLSKASAGLRRDDPMESTRAITAAGKTGLHGGSSIRARSLGVDFVRFFALSVEALLEFFAGQNSTFSSGVKSSVRASRAFYSSAHRSRIFSVCFRSARLSAA